MKNIFFDICAIPFYLLTLWTCHVRGLTKGRTNRLFILMACMSLISTVADLWMQFVVSPVPLSQGQVILGTALSFTYKLLRNSSLVVYFIYIFSVTRTEYRINTLGSRLLIWLPNAVTIGVLMQNFFTHNVFSVTAEGGYARGPVLMLLYSISYIYALAGTVYCIYCRRYLVGSKWVALISVYVLTFAGVLIQMVKPEYLVEMFSTAIGLMFILLLIMRPEETLDGQGLVQDWNAYQDRLKRILRSGRRFQIVVVQIVNAAEIRSYLGDQQFQSCIETIAGEIYTLYSGLRVHVDQYFEIPGTFYLILDNAETDVKTLILPFNRTIAERMEDYARQGVSFNLEYCLIKCPDDLKDFREIINFGHMFRYLRKPAEVYEAAELIRERNYGPLTNIKEILNRAITGDTLEMYFQPIYDIREGGFRSAEALARLNDPMYGMVSPAVFIPAAERVGMIVALGYRILEAVFCFMSKTDLGVLGISRIEINLSVAQCLQRELPERIRELQEKYSIDPRQVNFEVTETLFDNLGGIMDHNLQILSDMGYTFSLDDYGVGYSNIQRLRALPLEIIKIDKSMVDDMFTTDGEVIIENTVRMMKGIRKELVVEGVESAEAAKACKELSCDYIQGFYYSRPLPAAEFVRFLVEHNNAAHPGRIPS